MGLNLKPSDLAKYFLIDFDNALVTGQLMGADSKAKTAEFFIGGRPVLVPWERVKEEVKQ